MEVFSFAHNRVGDEGCRGVLKFLEGSEKIRSLDLEHCFLTDVGLKKIALGIDKNAGTLEKLIVRL